ncbi:MAG TPA: alkaline phosphatase family protein [Terriglobales bacterium]|nr:alkaline phosphatase family protein [Terriglobales bacterium]
MRVQPYAPGLDKLKHLVVLMMENRSFDDMLGALSITSATSVVPFYFQHTLGGSDINGVPWLSSYQDYRFRAPNLLVLRESFEHSIWGPFGF